MLMEPKKSGFHNLSLSPTVLAALDRANYHEPTPIQAALIPPALSGRDVIGQAQTGTGKTAAFLLPFLNRWRDRPEPGPHAVGMAARRWLVEGVRLEAAMRTQQRHGRSVSIVAGR